MPGLALTFANEDTLPLTFPVDVFRPSVHSNLLLCEACHAAQRQVPHPPVDARSRREYALARYEACKQCHFANYTKTLDSIHFRALTLGNPGAPVCTDCHGAHSVSSPSQPRSGIPQICAKCHAAIYSAYKESVHGQALNDPENRDVPICTDCHGVHNIQDSRTASFRAGVPQDVCGKCHANKALMSKYGISTNVLRTYLRDFHGVSVTLARQEGKEARSLEAVCSDCHGIHDIASVKSPNSPVVKANLVKTCQKCHEGATENFPAAWLSHYEPSLQHAPLVFLIRVFYRIFIPVVVVGLVIQVGANVWRATRRR